MSRSLRRNNGDDEDEDMSDEEVQTYEFASFSDEFVPFIAKNQFKNQIRKHAPLPKKDSIQAKIAMIMNPMEMTLTKDHVKVLLHIVPKTASDQHLFLPTLDTMEHCNLTDELLAQIKSGNEPVASSSIRRQIKKDVEMENSRNNASS